MEKKKYKFDLQKSTKKYLKDFKDMMGFKDYDRMFQWLLLWFDKPKAREYLEMQGKLELLKQGVIVFPTQDSTNVEEKK